jgi:hypothetical protein
LFGILLLLGVSSIAIEAPPTRAIGNVFSNVISNCVDCGQLPLISWREAFETRAEAAAFMYVLAGVNR